MKHSRCVAIILLVVHATVSTALSVLGPPPTFAYVHIPFCRRRCFYCDFPIEVVGDKGPNTNTAEAYVALLKREIAATACTQLRDDADSHGSGAPSIGAAVAAAGGLETLYVGGGTPSLLAPNLLAELLDTLKHHYGGFAPVSRDYSYDIAALSISRAFSFCWIVALTLALFCFCLR